MFALPRTERASILLLLTFLVTEYCIPQVRIRESIELKAKLPATQSMQSAVGGCEVPPSSGYSSFYFTMGGLVTVSPTWLPDRTPFSHIRLVALPSGTVVYDGPKDDFFGEYQDYFRKYHPVVMASSGDRLSFELTFYHGDVSVTGDYAIASSAYGTMGLKSRLGSFWPMFNSPLLSCSNCWSLSVKLQPDIATALDLRATSGPPREPCPLIAPVTGSFVARFNPNGYARNKMWFRGKTDSLQVNDAALFPYPINFGEVQVGDTIQLALISSAPGMEGKKTYPRFLLNPWSWTVPFWYMEFEEWIDNDFLDCFTYAWVAAPKYRITFDKEFFARPDTIRMFIESLGDEERPTEEMNVNIIDGRGIAILQDTLGNTFGTDIIERRYSRITKELRLVISPSAPPPLATKIAGNGTVWSEAEPEPERIIVQVFNRWSHVKSGRAEVKKSQMVPADILLGETKYYYAAADPTDQMKLKIEESSDPVTTSPAIQAQFTVEPVSTTPSFSIQLASSQRSLVAEPTQVTEKLGVYWEKKYPVWSGNTFVGMAELPAGVMRLMGRYWEEGKTYKVKLTASYPGKTGSIEIEVKNPARLGNSYAKSRDVFDNEIDIDDLCVKYGGEFGIPPQLIKGQMEKEAPTKNFGPYVGFAPAYRYEPFTTELLTVREDLAKWSSNPFFVTSTAMGEGDPVPDHKNTLYVSYPTVPKTVWHMVEQYSHLASQPSPGGVVL